MKNITSYLINEKSLNEKYLNEQSVDEIFKKQDEFVKKMIDRWKTDDKLKPFDMYFKWKSHEIDTKEFKQLSKNEIMQMMKDARKLSNAEYEKSNYDDDLIQILDAIEIELINIIGMFK